MPSSPVKYSKLNQSEENASQSKHALLEDPNSGYMSELEGPPLPANTLSKICGFFSCLLLLTCAVLAIAIAKVRTKITRWLQRGGNQSNPMGN